MTAKGKRKFERFGRGRSKQRPYTVKSAGGSQTRPYVRIAGGIVVTLDCVALMGLRGKFIAIEGIDGSGKRTQLDLLARELELRGVDCARFSFPRYESSFGRLVAQYLNGDFGPLAAVDAHLSALLYAGDRFESKAELESALNAGKTVLADRYIASNLAHQTARVGPERRLEFLAWLRKLEYGLYGLPAEDLVIYLRLPVSEAQRLVGMKEAREYTSLQRDLQEADQKHLEQAALVYESLAMEANWVTVNCSSGDQGLMTVEEIHAAVMGAVDERMPNLRGKK
jgi:dTMP kinase